MIETYTFPPLRMQLTNEYEEINNYNIFLKHALSDIAPLSTGESPCRISLPPPINSKACANLFHILDGSGTVYIDDRVYHIKGGDFFVVPLGAKAFLRADTEDGLLHRWISFIGKLRRDFERFPIPFTLPQEILCRLCDPSQGDRNLASRLTADLFLIHSFLHETSVEPLDYVQKVIDVVNTSYMKKISISDIAEELGITPCHLSRVFKEKMNSSIRDYILNFRLTKARGYLKHNYSVSDTARLCGFSDRSNFTKVFVRELGCTPTEWVKILDIETFNRPR